MKTYLHKIKCMGCGLHYIVCSWHSDWEPTNCPECPNGSEYIHWREETDSFIFQLVPGDSPMVSFGAEKVES